MTRYIGKKRKPLYGTTAWRRIRRHVLERDHYWCQRCKRTIANTVHHRIPVEERPDLALEETNLESLCEQCHNASHPERNRKAEAPSRQSEAPKGIRIAIV